MHVSVDGVYQEYVSLLKTFSILETEGDSCGSMTKGYSKSLKSHEFTGMLCTLRVMLPSLTALSKTFQTGTIIFSRITRNTENTKQNCNNFMMNKNH